MQMHWKYFLMIIAEKTTKYWLQYKNKNHPGLFPFIVTFKVSNMNALASIHFNMLALSFTNSTS